MIIAGKSRKILPAVSSEKKGLFTKQKTKQPRFKIGKWADHFIYFWRNRHSLISERICEKRRDWNVPLSLSVYSWVWCRCEIKCPYPSMNEHTQSGIYDLAQTPSGEIIINKSLGGFHLADSLRLDAYRDDQAVTGNQGYFEGWELKLNWVVLCQVVGDFNL